MSFFVKSKSLLEVASIIYLPVAEQLFEAALVIVTDGKLSNSFNASSYE